MNILVLFMLISKPNPLLLSDIHVACHLVNYYHHHHHRQVADMLFLSELYTTHKVPNIPSLSDASTLTVN
jgi:hypothetical protein